MSLYLFQWYPLYPVNLNIFVEFLIYMKYLSYIFPYNIHISLGRIPFKYIYTCFSDICLYCVLFVSFINVLIDILLYQALLHQSRFICLEYHVDATHIIRTKQGI